MPMPAKNRPRTLAPAAAPPPAVLDPRSLGRPVHLLPAFAQTLRERLNESLRRHWNQRYRVHYDVASAQLLSCDGDDGCDAGPRWLQAETGHGPVACQLERPLVLSLMAHRLGLEPADAAAEPQALPLETRTEERLHRLLAQQLLQACLDALHDTPVPAPDVQPVARPQPGSRAWRLALQIVRPDGQPCRATVLLAAAHVEQLLRRLAPQRAPRGESMQAPLCKRLTLKLQARLLERRLPLSQLLALRPGDLIPVHLSDADVLIDGQRLFTATVAEHQGKLCLTSFEDAE